MLCKSSQSGRIDVHSLFRERRLFKGRHPILQGQRRIRGEADDDNRCLQRARNCYTKCCLYYLSSTVTSLGGRRRLPSISDLINLPHPTCLTSASSSLPYREHPLQLQYNTKMYLVLILPGTELKKKACYFLSNVNFFWSWQPILLVTIEFFLMRRLVVGP